VSGATGIEGIPGVVAPDCALPNIADVTGVGMVFNMLMSGLLAVGLAMFSKGL
jgi:hypothetical protein